MEYEKIKQLIDDMGNSKLTAIDIEFPDGTKVSMKKEATKEVVYTSKEEKEFEKVEQTQAGEINTDEQAQIVKSPMVGTFYIKPSPTAEPYVEVGKDVKQGDTLCIIEAMKLMNEIESEFTGKIKEILVKDGQSVEYGTPLFKLEV